MGRLDPNLPVEALRTMEAQVRDNVFVDRIVTILSVAFAGLATLLAAVGLYGVLAYTVAQRTKEFGLRMALGADAGRIRGLVMRQVGRMTLIGGAVGLILAIGLGRVARSLLFELQTTDPVVLIAAVSALTLVALGAGALPAWAGVADRADARPALRVTELKGEPVEKHIAVARADTDSSQPPLASHIGPDGTREKASHAAYGPASGEGPHPREPGRPTA